jgi:hypothetical protein
MDRDYFMHPTRRHMIRSLVGGSMLFPGIVAQLLADEARGGASPLAPKAPHFPGKGPSASSSCT